MPVGLRVRLRVDLAQGDGGVDVAALVVDPQVDLEVRPVGRKRVENRLKVGQQLTRRAYLGSGEQVGTPPPAALRAEEHLVCEQEDVEAR